MFNLEHILYIVISSIVTVFLLYLSYKYVKEQKIKDLLIKISAVVTVIIHYSSLLVEYFQNNGDAYVENNHILPVYPCNILMWMLLILAFLENKKSAVYRFLAEFCFIVGSVCGIIGIVLNFNFDNTPTLADYSILKGLVSHSTMLFGCLYLYVGKYVKLSIYNTVSLVVGFSIFVICGLGVNALYSACGMESPDGIWIYGVPYIGVSSIILGLLAVAAYFGVFALIELRLPEEERWYSKIKCYLSSRKENKKKEIKR